MHPSVLRRINSIHVFHALRLNPGISQREIVSRTDIDKSTVSTIIGHFEGLGLIQRESGGAPNKRGRPLETLSLRAEAGLLVGIHLYPEKLLLVASGLDGRPTASWVGPPVEQEAAIAEAVETALDAFLEQMGCRRQDVNAIGLCVPGLITKSGLLAESSNMQWRNVDLGERLEAHLGRQVYLSNDSHGAGLAEKLFGCCIDVDVYIFIDSASGVGGVLFLNGTSYTGAGGFAGELGHIKVVPNGRPCACGATGCLSGYVSEPALLQRCAQLGLKADSFADLARAADEQSPAALMVLEEAGEMLAIALSNIINLFNPPMVVLGGGLALLAGQLLPTIERLLPRYTLAPSQALSSIVPSALAFESTPRSALALALNGLTDFSSTGNFPW